jgi:23S rRNA (cytosine1962-C5)-methyltransferase
MANDSTTDYELLDFGDGRKLERFGTIVLDRPCPAAEGVERSSPDFWNRATARYDRTQGDNGVWTPNGSLPKQWTIRFALNCQGSDEPGIALTFQVQPTPFGHVGVFPEQFGNWNWIVRQVARTRSAISKTVRALNLFAYTGGSTLAAAAAGAEVVHIDAARNIVDRARGNANLSGLGDRPIRWIVEDAARFCQRELKRGNQYDAVILDPPSYGHGPKGEPWKLEQDFLPLLRSCGELTAQNRGFVIVTCHSPGIGPPELAAYLAEGIFGGCSQPPQADELFLQASNGRRLPSGVFARWPA